MIALAILLFHILGFISSIHAVMANRTAQGAIARGVSLNTFPCVTVPLYWITKRVLGGPGNATSSSSEYDYGLAPSVIYDWGF